MASIGSLLAACSSKEQSKPTPIEPASAPLPKAIAVPPPKPESELVFHNWPDYIAEDTVPNFEKEFGVKVTFKTYENNDEILAKLQDEKSGIDVVCPSGYAGQGAISRGLIEKLNLEWIPNAVNIAPQFRNTDFDPKNEYTIPWLWGRTGIGYRKDKITTPIDSWSAFLNPDFKGKMTQMDNMRDVIGSWLKYRGKSINSVNVDDLAQAKEDALTSKKLLLPDFNSFTKEKAAALSEEGFVPPYISNAAKKMLIDGDLWVVQLWGGDIFDAQAEQPNIEWVIPKEGGSLWVDSLMIPKGAPHPNAAHAFLNYILRPDVGAATAEATGYGSTNLASQALIKKPVPFPTPVQARILEVQKDLGASLQLWEKIWAEIKAA
jgi:spermidine/putrescine transport system substrate-binding protein